MTTKKKTSNGKRIYGRVPKRAPGTGVGKDDRGNSRRAVPKPGSPKGKVSKGNKGGAVRGKARAAQVQARRRTTTASDPNGTPSDGWSRNIAPTTGKTTIEKGSGTTGGRMVLHRRRY